jgi:type VI secretion system protein ImpB
MDTFQREIPKARVNITLDVETGGVSKKKELPFKMLVMADFSHNNMPIAIKKRERIATCKENFDSVIAKLSPRLNLMTPNVINNQSPDLTVNLQFNSLADFHPDHVVKQVDELQKLLTMRNLLKELKANIIDNPIFKRELERVVKTNNELTDLQAQLSEFVP